MKKSCIPNIFTFINLGFGILSLLEAFNKRFFLAALFILIAALVDRYDGRIARYLQVTSDLGKELDSLADLVSFGVAPAILIFILYQFNTIGPYGIIGYALLLAYPICGSFRLARYNTAEFDGNFRGVPITIAGSILAVFVILANGRITSFYLPAIFMIILSYLMVSNFKLKKL